MSPLPDENYQPMVTCEVTGKLIPADEVIQFQGYTVGAEGKAELLERLQSGQALTAEIEFASGLRRFGAVLIDFILLGVVNYVLQLTLGSAAAAAQPSVLALTPMIVVMSVLQGIIPVAYFGLLHGTSGQTLGKMATKLRVVRADGGALTMGNAFARVLVLLGLNLIANVVAMVAMGAGSMSILMISGGIALVSFIYVIGSFVMCLIDGEKRAIHDVVCKTRVIQEGV